MTYFFLLVGVLLIGTAAGLALRALIMPRLRTGEALGNIGAYGYASAEDSRRPAASLKERLNALAQTIGNIVGGGGREDTIRDQLRAAGLYGTSPGVFMGYRMLVTLLLPGLWVWGGALLGVTSFMLILGLAAAVALGWVLPVTVLRRKARRRLGQIDYEMPELIDLLVVTVEAGMGLAGSLQLAGNRFGGPLGDELKLTLQEQSLGMSTTDALRNLLSRANTPNVRSFVRSIVQGEQLGVSIGQIMRNLSREMRTKRRQLAEEKAQKAPIKMLFPLVFLIFPAMFVILLGPAVFAFFEAV